MTPRRILVFWPVLLTAATVVLAWSVYSELTAAPGRAAWSIFGQLRPAPAPDTRAVAAIPNPVPLPPVPPAPEFGLPAVEAFTSVLARPMFSTMRRPPVEEVVVVATPEPTLDLTLRGIILSGTERIALIVPAARAEVVRIKESERFEGWTLVAVEADYVVFRLGIEELTFELSYDEPIPDPTPVRPRRRQPSQQPRVAPGGGHAGNYCRGTNGVAPFASLFVGAVGSGKPQVEVTLGTNQ